MSEGAKDFLPLRFLIFTFDPFPSKHVVEATFCSKF